jgi:alpha-aminoadipate carrier protein LysW
VNGVAFCPECDAEIEEEYEYEEGDIVDCPECGAELEVINTSPLEFEVVSYEEEEEEEEWE